MQVLAVFVLAGLCYQSVAGTTVVGTTLVGTTVTGTTVVVPTTVSPVKADHGNATVLKPQMYSFNVESMIQYRFAQTHVSTRIANPANISQEVFFSIVIPDPAFISGFLIEIDGKSYKAYVKKKEEAKNEYENAVREGRTAAHVALSARDSNRVTVSVNVEPEKKVTFNLTYDELLPRTLGVYSDVINIDPGQVVPDLRVVVRINETLDITTLNVPALKTSDEVSANATTGVTNPLVTVERPTPATAVITFAPTPDQQRNLTSEGVSGQLIVEYDLNRTQTPGEILVTDGYFVNFFAPTDLPPLPKQVTFVLDISGSMYGRKIEQLRQAMVSILSDLNPKDLFSIVIFSTSVQVWDPTKNDTTINVNGPQRWGVPYEETPPDTPLSPSVVAAVTPENIDKAKKFVENLTSQGSTDIYDALMKGLDIAQLQRNKSATGTNVTTPEPIIIFLTDGQPNVHVSDPKIIVRDVTKANTGNASIFSLALGDDADINFLRRLSLQNTGFARKIYEAGDTAIQLRNFYKQLESPLLDHVVFKYAPSEVVTDTVTQETFRRFFLGSELVVAGRLNGNNITGEVTGRTSDGTKIYPFRPIILPPGPCFFRYPCIPPPHNETVYKPSILQRLWAYLRVKQLLDQDEALDYDHSDKNYTSPEKKEAEELALKYSFVTRVTSLVVVKPNGTSSANTQDASQSSSPSFPGVQLMAFRSAKRTHGGLAGGAKFLSYASFPRASFGGFRPPMPFVPIGLTTTRATPPAPTQPPVPKLANLSDVTWLPANHTITLPSGEDLQVTSANQTNVPHSSCTTPTNAAGHCRLFEYCVLDFFTLDEAKYIPYACKIDNFAGVCCPDSLMPASR